jgi:hypothetical protein
MVAQPVKKVPVLMDPECSLLCSQNSITGSSSTLSHIHNLFLIILYKSPIYAYVSYLASSLEVLPAHFYAFLISPILVTCPSQLTFLYLTTPIIFHEHANYEVLHCVIFPAVVLLSIS